MSDEFPLELDVSGVTIHEVGRGYELVLDTDDTEHPLVAYESPRDGLWEQLVEEDIIEVGT